MARPEVTGRRMYSRAEFCRAHGVGATTFHKLVKTGALVALKMFGRTMVTVEDAERWQASLPRISPHRAPIGGA